MSEAASALDLTETWAGYWCLLMFVLAHALAYTEEYTSLRGFKPFLLYSGVMWLLVAYYYATHHGDLVLVSTAYEEMLSGFAETFLLLLVVMAYVNSLEERRMTEAVASWIRGDFTYRRAFWVFGWLAFFMSGFVYNVVVATLLGAVLVSVGHYGADRAEARFVGLTSIAIVVASNAGGVLTPFGDVATLLIWRHTHIQVQQFFLLFLPALVNWLVIGWFLSRAVPEGGFVPEDERYRMKRGANRILVLFLITLTTTVAGVQIFALPAVLGMMLGLSYLAFFYYYLKMTFELSTVRVGTLEDSMPIDMGNVIARVEWSIPLYYYGVLASTAALGVMGYFQWLSDAAASTGPTFFAVLFGVLSAVIENTALIYAATAQFGSDNSLGQWLLLLLTTSVGGSLLIGSAPALILLAITRGSGYTLGEHVRWTKYIALGFFAAVLTHLIVNFWTFSVPLR
jgi:Na+/H+ antiporter NhaD/arsenite permease-like protein